MALIGLGFLFVPAALSLGAVPAGGSDALIGFLRVPASTFIGIAVLDWMARNAEASPARNAIVLANTVGFALAAVLGVWAVHSGGSAVAWVFVVIELLLAAGFFWTGRTSMSAKAS
jgi:hypothetical protein